MQAAELAAAQGAPPGEPAAAAAPGEPEPPAVAAEPAAAEAEHDAPAAAEGEGDTMEPSAANAPAARAGSANPEADAGDSPAAPSAGGSSTATSEPAPPGAEAEPARQATDGPAAPGAGASAVSAAPGRGAAGDAAGQGAAQGSDPSAAGRVPTGSLTAPGGAQSPGGAQGTDPSTPGGVPAGSLTAPGGAQSPTSRGEARRAPVLDPEAIAAARDVLVAGGAPGELAEEAVRVLGEGAGGALRGDPWLVLGVGGVRVEDGDAFARSVLGGECGPGDERRGRALVGRVLEDAARHGHTAVPSAELLAALGGHAVPDPPAAMSAAVAEGQVLVFRDASQPLPEAAPDDEEEAEADVPLLIGLDRYALAEESLADGLIRLLRSFDTEADWEQAATAAPSPSAAELIRAAASSGLVVHTGGEAARHEPAALVSAARAAGLRAYAAAYTDDSRRRLAEAVGDDAAVTVAGLLAGRHGPGRAPDGTLALDLLAVFDAPQLGVEEAADLVEAVPDGARLVLSGDPNVLWSAGPGRAFADLLAAKCCPRVSSRTPDPGPIGELVSGIGVGELAAVEAPDKEVVVVPVRDPREAVLRAVQLVADSVPRAIGVPPERTQVITPAHGGAVGTRVLNAALKERLNPGPGRFGGFDPGDRVVHVPFPGRTLPGTVVGAEPDGLLLDGPQGRFLVPRADVAGTVRHGWAITGHQAAGARWPAVVVVVPGDAGPLLTRSWVYSAFARGERHLSVVQGADQALAAAVAGAPAKERTTRLTSVLKELAADS
ncbi:AAA family ATPase [Streptomyces sp. CA-111067]|uniref:AAA family ATPase n=1 Tax=Streptomyces sp. CA-111067 TaxID=3240046 RepID=UPI003D986CDE